MGSSNVGASGMGLLGCKLQNNRSKGAAVQRSFAFDQSLATQHTCRHFFREEPMCKATSFLQDQPSVNEYLELITTWIKDTTSLIATSLTSGRVVGVAILRIDNEDEKTNTYNRVQIIEGETLKKIMHLRNSLTLQTKAHEKFGHNEYVTVYILYVHPSYQGKGVEVALLNACVQEAITLKMPAIGGIFTCGKSQAQAEQVGFELISEIRYSQWIIDDRIVFDDPGRGNYTAAFMGKVIQLEEDKED
ncbi:uncharacterized protein LOC105662944 isoform X2 [Megachile rotundata]|uniref:uncharacterized protein LOC105662944 isoform X2 n=1 Tax=Megachile rotundata TaxID=143995 RepID=UPI003FD2080F